MGAALALPLLVAAALAAGEAPRLPALASSLLEDVRRCEGPGAASYRDLAAADRELCQRSLDRWKADGGAAKPPPELLNACRALPAVQEAAAAHLAFAKRPAGPGSCEPHFALLAEKLRGACRAPELAAAVSAGLSRCRARARAAPPPPADGGSRAPAGADGSPAAPGEAPRPDAGSLGRTFDGSAPRRTEPSTEPAILSDARFTRRQVLVQYDGVQMNDQALAAVLQGLDLETEVVVLATDAEAARRAVRASKVARPGRVRVEEAGGGLGPWARDYFIAVATEKGPGGEVRAVELVRPREIPSWTPEGEGDRPAVQKALEKSARDFYRFRRSAINFEGGMIVNDGRVAFVSKAVERINPSLAPEALARALKGELRIERLVLVEPLRGWKHIDLYVTPLGGREVLVADTAAGARLVSEWLGTEPPASNPRAELLESLCGRPASPRAVFRDGRYSLPEAEWLAKPLDDIAARLEAELKSDGYRVRRIPSLLGRFPSAFTYNNIFQTSSRALIPSFGIEPLDVEAWELYTALGLRPKSVPATRLACTGGVLHCSVHEIGVTDPPAMAQTPPPQAQ